MVGSLTEAWGIWVVEMGREPAVKPLHIFGIGPAQVYIGVLTVSSEPMAGWREMEETL